MYAPETSRLPQTSGVSSLRASSYSKLFWLEASRLPPDRQRDYHVYGIFHYQDLPDVQRLETALQLLANVNYNLRTTFTMRDGELQQVIRKQQAVALSCHTVDTDRRFDDTLSEAIGQPFDMAHGPLFRFVLIHHRGNGRTTFVPIFHHIILDGTQFDAVMQQIGRYYDHPINSSSDDDADLGALADYLEAESELTAHSDVRYWADALRHHPLHIPFPSKHRAADGDSRELRRLCSLPPGLRAQLERFSSDHGHSVFRVLKMVWSILISVYADQERLVISFPVNMRGGRFPSVKGCYVNTLFSFFDRKAAFLEHLEAEKSQGASPHRRSASRLDIMAALAPMEHDLSVSFSQSGLFIRGPVLGSHPEPAPDHFVGGLGGAKLCFFYQESADALSYGLAGLAGWVDEAMLGQMQRHFEGLLTRVLADPGVSLNTLSCLSQEEQHHIVYGWNQPPPPTPGKTIQELFEAHAEHRPHAVAVTHAGGSLSYGALNAQANRLAHHLRSRLRIKEDDLIALCLDRSEQMLVAILGILKSGAAYVPLDPGLPEERLGYILEEAKPKAIITESRQARKLAAICRWQPAPIQTDGGHDAELLEMDSPGLRLLLSAAPEVNPGIHTTSRALAYVMFTSGTSGRPKGVMIEQGSVAAFSVGNDYVSLGPGDNVLGISNYAFDGSVFDIFASLLNGATLHVADTTAVTDGKRLKALTERHGITHLFIPTALFQQYAADPGNPLASIRNVLVGGDTIDARSIRTFIAANGATNLLHVYGPTETVVFATSSRLHAGNAAIAPIGTPLSDKQCYILDVDMRPRPIGCAGELHIGGPGVARGYLNDPVLTAQRFVADPFHATGRLYKTGDMARYAPDGSIEFLGRTDFQVKIRGFRIELGEIEHWLSEYPGVKHAVVVAREHAPSSTAGRGEASGSKYLAGYYVADDALDASDLLAYLSRHLPDYMVPAHVVHVRSLPLNASGKLDRKALPRPEWKHAALRTAPRTQTEQRIRDLYASLFAQDADRIGIEANFFRLGGTSILAIQLAHRLSRLCGVDVPVADIFRSDSIETLAKSIDAITAPAVVIPAATGSATYPLSFAQERLWFIEQYEHGTSAYHMPWVVKLATGVSPQAVTRALTSVVARHEVLRTLFIQDEAGQERQCVQHAPLDVVRCSCTSPEDYQRRLNDDVHRPFDLRVEYPIRACLYRMAGTDDHRLLVNMHHIASDGWSIDVFQRELVAFYDHYHLGEPLSLPALPIQYKDFAVWQRSGLSGDALGAHLQYWRARLADYETLQLPTDKPRPSRLSYAGTSLPFSLTPDLSRSLRQLAGAHECTLYTVLLAGFYVLLHAYSGQDDIILGTPQTVRPYQSTHDLIGLFLNVLVQRERLDVEQPLAHLIEQIRRHHLEAQPHQDLPFEALVQDMGANRDASRHALFQVTFAVQTFGRKNPRFARYFQTEDVAHTISSCDLGCLIDDSQAALQGSMLYAGSLFEEATIRRMTTHYVHILSQAVDLPARPLKAYQTLTPDEYRQVIHDWNPRHGLGAPNHAIDELFETQVAKAPDAIAVIRDGQATTYAALNARANQVAHHLARSGVTRETPVGVGMERSETMIAGILGILKSGGSCVPLDISEPPERLRRIVEDTNLSIVLVDDASQDRLAHLRPHAVLLNMTRDSQEPAVNLLRDHDAGHLAFVVYTSGSTGIPKGVMIPHRVFSRCASWATDVFRFTDVDRFLFRSIRAPEEFLFPLFIGAALIVAPPGAERDPLVCVRTLVDHKISVANFTPSFLGSLLDLLDSEEGLTLRHVFCAGEPLSADLRYGFASRVSAHLYNFYGLAEAPYTAYRRCDAGDASVLIGKPVDADVYVLDSHGRPVPVGTVGELHIGGPGLARGYLNQPALTSERFIPSPFREGARLYKSGDLVRYLPDGHLEYVGRNDCQVKIRGFRVELGEIEHHLSCHPGIKQAVVVAHDSGQDRASRFLVGYYVADVPLDETVILDGLSRHLPDHMVPALLIHLDRLPLNANGKLNRKALPTPEWKHDVTCVAPRNRTEERIRDVFADVLALPAGTIGTQADFFRLGGNSILAIRVAHLLSRGFDVHLPVVEVFRTKTIEHLAKAIEAISTRNIAIPIAPTSSRHPLSFAQERLWFIENYEPGTAAYHIPCVVKLADGVLLEALAQALRAIVERHEILRTVFVQDGTGKGYQVVQDAPLAVTTRRCDTFEEYQEALEDDVNAPFDLKSDYPLRVRLYEVTNGAHRYLLVNFHHIACDGWSIDLFQKELIGFYEHYCFGMPLSLPALSIQYKDFAAWQRTLLSGESVRKQLEYWRSRLEGHETLRVPTDMARPANVDYAGAGFTFDLPAELADRLRALARDSGCSLYAVLLSAFYVLLHKYTGQTDIVVGSPIANRHYEATRDSIGFFVNMLVQRERLDLQRPIARLIAQIHRHLVDAHQHQDVPFERLLQELDVERDTGRHPLFQVMFAVQRFGREEGHSPSYYEAVDITGLHAVTRFDLELFIDDSRPALQCNVHYATSLFRESTIRRWAGHYAHILGQMVSALDQPLRAYQALTGPEYRQVTIDWNRTARAFPDTATLQSLFEAQVARTPLHVAVVYQHVRLTYQVLNERANRLAHHLRETFSVNADDLIALCVRRSEDVLVGILGILKSGAAYVPIDADSPDERLRVILQDSHAKAVVTHQSLLVDKRALTEHEATVVLDSPDTARMLDLRPSTNPSLITISRNLAYVIFTSGTTGAPKGVMVEHRSVVNTLSYLKDAYDLSPGDRTAAFTQYAFDVSVSEFFIALFNGAELHVLSDTVRKDAALLSAYIRSNVLHYVYLPPALLALLPRVAYPELRGIVYAGEPCDVETGTYWSKRCKLFNFYGPTETTVYSVGKQVVDGDVHLIGKPIANTLAYVLDADLTPVPVGVVGELHIGGVGLARGYLNDPELTAEKFVANPFQSDSRLYKTGDLVRYLPCGDIEYIGRNDSQIKIRGFRVELGEIEQRLLQHPGIMQAVVISHTFEGRSGHRYLVGYCVADAPFDEVAVLGALSRYVPDYMVPARLVRMDTLPLTPNGKVNRKALPRPGWTQDTSYVAPRNASEERICDTYAELFSQPAGSISVQANFFSLGGNSILAIQAAHRLSRLFDVHLPVAELFRAKTIEQLARSIASITTRNIVIPTADGETRHPLSFAQERLWFIEQYEQGTAAYHMPRLVKLRDDVDVAALTRALQAIVERHEVLRTVFVQDEDGREFQVVQDAPLPIHRRICATPVDFQRYLRNDVNVPFDLRTEYPIRACLYDAPESAERHLLVNMHHIASDGWSIDVFQKELVAYYEHFQVGAPLALPALSIQYKDFAVWQRGYLSGSEVDRQAEYWRTRLAGHQPLRLATDKPRPNRLSYAGRTFFFYLTPELSSQLRAFAQQHDYSLYVVLLAGFYMLLHQCSGQTDIIVGTPVANRHYEPIKDLMGSFVNVIAQREQLDVDGTILDLMERVHQHLIDIQQYQDIPFERVIHELNIERDIRVHPLFQVMFSVQSFGIKEPSYARYFETVDITDIHPITRFDLACFVSTANPVFKGLISYSTDLYDDVTMRRFVDDYIAMLTQAVNEPEKPLGAYAPTIVRMKHTPAGDDEGYAPDLEEAVAYVPPRNTLENHICRFFAEIFALPIETVGIHADFFHLGGTSISAMQLAARIERLSRRAFPIIEVFRSRTVEGLAVAANAEQPPMQAGGFVVPLRQRGARKSIFMLPGARGEEFMLFMSVGTHLRFDGDVYGVRSRVLDPDWAMPTTLREQAEAVFESIRTIQPRGPYYFFGECVASSLALHLQQLAEEQGHPSGMVFLLNSLPLFGKECRAASNEGVSAKARRFLQKLKFFATAVEDPLTKLKKGHRFLQRTLFVSRDVSARIDQYYRLLHSAEPVRLKSEMHLLLAADEEAYESIVRDWQPFFEDRSSLHRFDDKLSTDRRGKAIARILDGILP